MKVTFIYPDLLFHRHDWKGYYYNGIGSLSGVLKREGHETSLIHITSPINKSDFIKTIKKECPDLIGFSSTSPMFPFVRRFASWLVEAKIDVPTICGGIHPTIAPEESIAAEGIDIICRGEGEAVLADLCRRLQKNEEIDDIKNLWIKRDNTPIIKNPLRPVLDDLDTLPFPDRSIFSCRELYNERLGRTSFLVSRGCSYNCSYCCNHLKNKIYGITGKPQRFRSVDNVIAEIKEVLEQYPFIFSVIFDDDILLQKKEWSEEFVEKYRREIKLPFICNANPKLLDKRKVDLHKKAGCFHIKMGLESGNEHISNDVLNRRMTNEDIKKAFALCKAAGLICESFNMVGLPFETPGCVLDTIKLNADIGVNKMQISIYQPYVGTKLADLCKKEGFWSPQDLGPDWFGYNILALNTISPSQVMMFRNYFKIFVRYYQAVQRIGGKNYHFIIRFSDRVLSSPFVSKLLNFAYIPMNILFRNLQYLKIKAVSFKCKLAFGFNNVSAKRRINMN